MLLEALRLYEASLCSGCGQSGIHAHDIANTPMYELGEVTCRGCEILDNARSGDAKQVAGEKLYIENYMDEMS